MTTKKRNNQHNRSKPGSNSSSFGKNSRPVQSSFNRSAQSAGKKVSHRDAISRADKDGFAKPKFQWRREVREASTKRSLFIYNVNANDTEHTVKRFLRDNNMPFNTVRQVSHPYAKKKSFAVAVAKIQFNDMLHHPAWPSDIKVREFIDRRRTE